MGIRIHKVIGYGLADVASEDISKDQRFNDRFERLHNALWGMKWNALAHWAHKHRDRIFELSRREWPDRPLDEEYFDTCFKIWESGRAHGTTDHRAERAVHRDAEYGLASVVLFNPFVPDWSRYDDLIDYYEEIRGNPECHNRFEWLEPSGIFPWSGSLIRYREASAGVPEFLATRKILDGANIGLTRAMAKQGMDVSMAVDADLASCWRARFPVDLMILMAYLEPGMPNLERTVDQLRPMLYVYWS